jgi:hypothetical protein
MIAKEHESVVAEPDGFKQSIAIPESPVGKGNRRLIHTDEMPVEYAITILCHSVRLPPSRQQQHNCKVVQKEKVNLLIINQLNNN